MTSQNATAAHENRMRAAEKERAERVVAARFRFPESHGYSDEVILEDPRVAAEMLLRESGLLERNSWAVARMLKEVAPPTAPRPEMRSQIIFEE